ncbi:NADH dehydrogenase [ubiquinone] 1 alpha subcomplex subunit 13 [Trichinella nativa]|uniref:NADH dehydrogenase [ubiquinone] 1 alpha subcomplex subunit 13 n=1 Tax=Trichinella nativa TaxID=6335 RepID=A0A0V1LE95_9BILA|nr:NADH dehydrogenase [ubiquinone] 1 alpha subcomplex subunit 13 [Trichinella nativa]OUC47732.1 LPXTG-motif protein cell wall anchor domain protein [Trichinella nativa]
MEEFVRGKIDYVQDMPRQGGYSKIFYERTFPKTGIPWWKFVVGGVTMFTIGALGVKGTQRHNRMVRLEDNDVRIALEPFIMAERDRMWLKLLRSTRDKENDVMKNVPGWQTGTWYGEPIFFTLAKDKWWDPEMIEVYTHSRPRHIKQHVHWHEHDEYAGPHWWDKFIPHFLLENWIK